MRAVTKHRLRHMGKFFALFSFMLFTVFYCGVVLLQTAPTQSYLAGGVLRTSTRPTLNLLLLLLLLRLLLLLLLLLLLRGVENKH
jgi:hypothetical protein